MSINSLVSKYKIRHERVEYLIRLIDKHGYDILRTKKNRKFTPYEKEQIINKVLVNNESACSVAIDEGLLSQGMLQNWIKRLEEENEYLKAEIEYSKKLRAVVQARKNQQQKKK